MSEVYIVSGVRTPIGSMLGAFTHVPAHELGSVALREAIARAGVAPEDVDHVVVGQALTAGCGQNPGRQAAIKAGLPITVPAYVVSFLCGSGLQSVISGYQSIKCGDARVVACVGQESMTRAPHTAFLRPGLKTGDVSFKDSVLRDGLTDVFHDIHMGITSENLVDKYNISRQDQDEYAFESQMRVKRGTEAGHFDAELVPVSFKASGRDARTVTVAKDEYPKPDANLEAMRKLQPAFKKDGTVTAANTSGINDAAAAVVLMSKEEAVRRGAPVLAKIVGHALEGCEPSIMGFGPVPAVESVLRKVGWGREDVDLWELNEASAAQSLACLRALKLDAAKVNIDGGAISLGHPIGCSGTRILVTLLYALKRTGGKRGVAALCIGGGMGIAIAVERV